MISHACARHSKKLPRISWHLMNNVCCRLDGCVCACDGTNQKRMVLVVRRRNDVEIFSFLKWTWRHQQSVTQLLTNVIRSNLNSSTAQVTTATYLHTIDSPTNDENMLPNSSVHAKRWGKPLHPMSERVWDMRNNSPTVAWMDGWMERSVEWCGQSLQFNTLTSGDLHEILLIIIVAISGTVDGTMCNIHSPRHTIHANDEL